MQKLEPITIINVDDVPHAVSDMSDTVKRLVDFYNSWREQEAEQQSALLMTQAAMRDISREIVLTIKSDKEAAEASAQAVTDAAAAADAASEPVAEPAIELPSETVVPV